MKRHHHLPTPSDGTEPLPPRRPAVRARRTPDCPETAPAAKSPPPGSLFFADFLAAAMTLPPELLADFEP